MACKTLLDLATRRQEHGTATIFESPGATPNIHNAADAVQLSADLAAICAWGRRRVASPGLLPQAWEAPLHDVRRRDGGAPLREHFTTVPTKCPLFPRVVIPVPHQTLAFDHPMLF